jgi:gas vesicle protein
VAGTVIGLCIAPQPGEKTRVQLRDAYKAVREGAEVAASTLRRMAPVVAPVASSMVDKVRRRNEDDLASVYGNGSLGSSPPV